jgi:hypothetical protein
MVATGITGSTPDRRSPANVTAAALLSIGALAIWLLVLPLEIVLLSA